MLLDNKTLNEKKEKKKNNLTHINNIINKETKNGGKRIMNYWHKSIRRFRKKFIMIALHYFDKNVNKFAALDEYINTNTHKHTNTFIITYLIGKKKKKKQQIIDQLSETNAQNSILDL